MEKGKQELPVSVSDINKSYPTHGIIGTNPPGWLNLGSLHRSPPSSSSIQTDRDPRRRKLDLEGALDQCYSVFCPQHGHHQILDTPMPDWNEGKKTSETYPEITESGCNNQLPDRFDNPSWFKGYGCEKRISPFYATTSSQYGKFPPNVHTMPNKYCPMKNVFSEHLNSTGKGRNRSLNMK